MTSLQPSQLRGVGSLDTEHSDARNSFDFSPVDKFHFVEIYLQPDVVIKIDSITLKRCSEFFQKSLSDFWLGKHPNYKPSQTKIIYELDFGNEPGDDMLEIKQTEPTETTVTEPESETEWEIERIRPCLLAYKNLFRIFAHESPSLQTTDEVVNLLKVARKYLSMPCVSKSVRSCLLDCDVPYGDLYFAIYLSPQEFIWIGEEIKSKHIVMEASVHIIGRWHMHKDYCKNHVSKGLFDVLCESYERARTKMEHANLGILALSLDLDPRLNETKAYRKDLSIALTSLRERITQAFKCYKETLDGGKERTDWLIGDGTTSCGAAQLYREVKTAIDSPETARLWRGLEDEARNLRARINACVGDLAANLSHVPEDKISEGYLLSERLNNKDLPWKSNKASG